MVQVHAAIGTVLAGPALEAIQAGKAYYGKAPILGTLYVTGYEPIKDASGAIIGIWTASANVGFES